MKLNLRIIADYLTNIDILFDNAKWQTERTLKYPIYYMEGDPLSEDFLYVAIPEMLPKEPQATTGISLICLGYSPIEYHQNGCELLCVSTQTDVKDLFNQLMELFHRFQEYEQALDQALHTEDPFSAMATTMFSITQTPVYGLNRFDLYYFIGYDPQRIEFTDTYRNAKEMLYDLEEEHQLLRIDKDFQESYHTKEPSFLKAYIYGVDTIYQNLFSDSNYLGRIVIDNAYRPLLPSEC